MKPFLGIDITNNKKNEENNSDALICRSASPALRKAQEEAGKQASKQLMKVLGKTLALSLTKYLCLIAAVTVTLAGPVQLYTGHDFSLRAAYEDSPWLFWLVAAMWIGTVAVWILLSKKQKKADESEEDADLDPAFSDLESIGEAIAAELGIPENAPLVDVITFTYKQKDDEAVPKAADPDFTPYTIEILHAYREGENLCLVGEADQYAFPLSGLKTIRTVDKRLSVFSFWNKETNFDEGIYRAYDIKEKDSNLLIKPYHILEAEINGTLWGIYFPCYELPVFEELTGLKAK
ncbi:MAG: hypothetical protein IJ043_00350 [Clostridia bacterium]|nr:hypothetical protein [Clostridia bacterium]